MGGGGDIYDRDVTRTSSNQLFSDFAEKVTSRSTLDPAVNPMNRILTVYCRSPLVYGFDNTGSMDSLPKIIVDKMAMVCGQIMAYQLFVDPLLSIGTFGDAVTSEPAPVQCGDFVLPRSADDWFKRLWLYGGGGGNHRESYELFMYYHAYMTQFRNAETPFFVMTGDEGFRHTIPKADLDRIFGTEAMQHEATTAEQVFADLDAKFNGNVFIVRRRYRHEARVMDQWVELMGRGRIALLPEDKAVADVTLGVMALATGRMTLDEYCDSMVERDQTERRVSGVRAALEPVAEYAATLTPGRTAEPNNDESDGEDELPPIVYGDDDEWFNDD